VIQEEEIEFDDDDEEAV